MNIVIVEPGEVDGNSELTLSDARAAHLLDVLNVAIDATVRVGMLDGPFGIGTVVALERRSVRLRCRFDGLVPDRPRVDLLLAVPRPKVMRRLWAQLAALGVGRIMLTNAAKVERDYFDTHLLTEPLYRPLLIEGLQQARDTRLPLVSIHRRFRILVEDDLETLVPETTRLLAHPGESSTLHDAAARNTGRVVIAIGPEGGWNDFECGLLRAHRFVPVGIGERTLRTDTACVALLSILHETLRGATGPSLTTRS